MNNVHNDNRNTNYTPWILGGLAAAIVAGFVMYGSSNNNTAQAPNTAPGVTTGSSAMAPALPNTTGTSNTANTANK